MRKQITFLVLSAVVALSTSAAQAAIRTDLVPGANTFSVNDDGSTGPVNIGFTANFFGTTYSQLYVNNNGNVTFNGPLGTYTPFGLTTSTSPIIAPFFADVQTLPGSEVTYGLGILEGRNAFVVNWIDVRHYWAPDASKANSFQLVLIDRSDVGVGDFDIEFNYDKIEWETGDASGGSNGLGGDSARVGYTNGGLVDVEFEGSGVNGAFLDNGPAATALIHNSNVGIDGRYVFQARNGTVVTATPEPSSIAILAGLITCFGGSSMWRRRRQSAKSANPIV